MGRFTTTPYVQTGTNTETGGEQPTATNLFNQETNPIYFDLDEFEPRKLAAVMSTPSESELFAKIARVQLGKVSGECAFNPESIHVIDEFPQDSRFAWCSVRQTLRTNPEAVDYFYYTENGIRKLAVTTRDALIEFVQDVPYPCAIGLADRFLDNVEGSVDKYYARVTDWGYADTLLYFASLGIHPIDFFEETEILDNIPCAFRVNVIQEFIKQSEEALDSLIETYKYIYEKLCPRGTDSPNFFGSALEDVMEYLKEKGFEINSELLSVEFLMTPVVVFPEAVAILPKKVKKQLPADKLKTKWAIKPSSAFMETSLRMKDEYGELVVISRNKNLADRYRRGTSLLN